MTITYGDVPFLDPGTGRFPDSFAPPSVAADKATAAQAAIDAATAKGLAESARDAAAGSAGAASTKAGEALSSANAAAGSASTATAKAGEALSSANNAAGVLADASAPKVYYVEIYQSLFGGLAGAYPDARWANSSHLTTAGLTAWAAHILAHSPIPTTGAVKVVWFGDSWMLSTATLATATTTWNPSATVVVSGVGGNKSADLIARFAADVPADADYVIFNEPGVNDVYGLLSAQTVTANLNTLVGLVRGIGAVPVIAGQVPLSEHPTRSATVDLLMRSATTARVYFPAVDLNSVLNVILNARSTDSQALGVNAQGALTTGVSCTAFGAGTQAVLTTGGRNTAFGTRTQAALTAGGNNTSVGTEAHLKLTTGNNNVAVGDQALFNATTGSSNTSVGQNSLYGVTTGGTQTACGSLAGFGATTGNSNTFVGASAGYSPNGVVANKTTTASGQTLIGYQSGQGTATPASYITAIGYNATVATGGGFALGTDTTSAGAASTGVNEGVLGTPLHTVKVPGRFNIAQRTPTGSADTQGQVGDITSDAEYLYVKTAAGWKRTALAAW